MLTWRNFFALLAGLVLLEIALWGSFSFSPISEYQQATNGAEQGYSLAHSFTYRGISWLIDWIDRRHDFVAAAATLIIAIFTITLWRSTDKMWLSAEKQIKVAISATKAAERSADVAEKSILFIDRPWVSIKIECNGPLEFKSETINAPVRITLTNIGKSPATNVSYQAVLYADIAEASVEGNHLARKTGEKYPAYLNFGRVLFPDEVFSFTETLTLDRATFIERINIVHTGPDSEKLGYPAVCVIANYGLPGAGPLGKFRVTTELVAYRPGGPHGDKGFSGTEGIFPSAYVVKTFLSAGEIS